MSETPPLPLSEFDFDFPEELIADEPAEPRDSSRLMVVGREDGAVAHRRFRDLPALLSPGDCLVVNRTKVLPCRLAGRKTTGGRVELLLVRELAPGSWTVLSSGLKPGGRLLFEERLEAEVEALNEEGEYVCRFNRDDLASYMDRHGLAPLPPYILKKKDRTDGDLERYQTIYARAPGSIAAPTAGLHFTEEVLAELKSRGVRLAELTLHVGRGTFRPIQGEDAARHRMLAEWFELSPETAAMIDETRANRRRVVAVGTTSTRTLETLAARTEGFGPGRGWSELYIRPGHRFNAVDCLLTNFHLPRSTPLLLAAAFVGRERLLAAYREAFRERYRLYSYGDAMLIL